jgi:hypothetical protein
MGITDWETYLKERLRALDPTIKLNKGSPAMIQVIDPILRRLAPDPLETPVSPFILTRLAQEHPNLYTREGSTISDLLVKPSNVLIEPVRREIMSVKRQLSMLFPDLLSADEANSCVGNFFVTRNMGDYARVRVRIYFQNPISVPIGSTNVAFTATGLRFLPTVAQSITAEAMLANWDGNRYYFDVNYVAERAGTSYNIEAGTIIGVTGLSAATMATNLSKASPGLDEETTSALISRTEKSLGERSLSCLPGIVYLMFEQFPTLRILQVIGFNDVEMERDVLVGGNLGEIEACSNNGETVDDGDVDGYTNLFQESTGAIDFTTEIGPVGTDASGYTITVWITATSAADYQLGEVIGAQAVTINDSVEGTDRLPDNLANARWTLRKSGILTLSDIPGGIIFPDANGRTLTVPSNEVHIGGCTDFYLRAGTPEVKTLSITAVADQDVIARLEDAETFLGSPVILLNDLTADQWALVVENQTTLLLEQGSDARSYRVIQKMPAGPPYAVRVSSDMTATAANISYLLVDDIDIDLLAPKDIRYEGTDLRTIAGSDDVDTVSGLPDFVDVGVVDTDVVEILDGDDEGVHLIDAAGVLPGQLSLQDNMVTTESPLAYRIYRLQTGIDLPLLRITRVECLNASLGPTGELIPYRHPVDVVSRSFQNPGREAKAGTRLDATEGSYLRAATPGAVLLTAVDSTGAFMTGIDYWALGVRPGDLVNINSTDNQGYYTVELVGTHDGLALDYQIQVTEPLRWPTAATLDMEYEIGSPSYGSFRLYFLDPCSFEATYEDTVFTVQVDGVDRNFVVDPDVDDEYLPTPVTIPVIAMQTGFNTVDPYQVLDPVLGFPSIDLMVHGIAQDDEVEITYAPLVGDIDLSAGGINLDGMSMLIEFGTGLETVTFVGTALSVDEIVSQINAQLSQEVCSRYDQPGPTNYIMFRADVSITIKNNAAAGALDATPVIMGTRPTWNPWLTGNFAANDTTNDSPEKGHYLASAVTPFPLGSIVLTELNGAPWVADFAGTWSASVLGDLGHYIRISRRGRQRISSTDMEAQRDDLGFYYFDVECISEGFGTPWNIAAELQGTAAGYYSEGWEVTVEDDHLSYSMDEHPWLHITPRILVVGNDADETNKVELLGANIQVTYERDAIVDSAHTYVRDPQVRDVCESPLVRSLFPKFVRTTIYYEEGAEASDIRTDLAEMIEAILPDQGLQVSDMVQAITDTGGSHVTLPIVVVGIGHQADRTIVVERTENELLSGRLSALIPDSETVNGIVTSFLNITRLV